jgi:hypothetical protein
MAVKPALFLVLGAYLLTGSPLLPGFAGMSGGTGIGPQSSHMHPALITWDGSMIEAGVVTLYGYGGLSERPLRTNSLGYFHSRRDFKIGGGVEHLEAFGLYQKSTFSLHLGKSFKKNSISARYSPAREKVDFEITRVHSGSILYARRFPRSVLFAGGGIEAYNRNTECRSFRVQIGGRFEDNYLGSQGVVIQYNESLRQFSMDVFEAFSLGKYITILCGIRSHPSFLFLGLSFQNTGQAAGFMSFLHKDLGWSRAAACQYRWK